MRPHRHLGAYSDLVDLGRGQHGILSGRSPDANSAARIREALGLLDVEPRDVRTECRWNSDGIVAEEVSWSLGFGPRTHAYLLKPEHAPRRLPGVLALHCHAGAKWYGKEKIADGPRPPADEIVALRDELYGGRAFAQQLARAGTAVLVHDVFCWGSRRFPLADMPEGAVRYADDQRRLAELEGRSLSVVNHYDAAARNHENTVAKYCGLLGTSFAGVVVAEDLAAASYLRDREDVIPERIGAIGLSGGGCRAAFLGALDERLHATAVVAMTASYEDMLDGYVGSHTWMLFPPGLSKVHDWPEVVAAHAPRPLLALYAERDELFPPIGMHKAHERISAIYDEAGTPENYQGNFVPTGHCFDVSMQDLAIDWLLRHLSPL